MTIDEVLYVMDNHSHFIVVQNDARIDELNYSPFCGEVEEFKSCELYEEISEEEVTDMYATQDGTIWICYCNEENY